MDQHLHKLKYIIKHGGPEYAEALLGILNDFYAQVKRTEGVQGEFSNVVLMPLEKTNVESAERPVVEETPEMASEPRDAEVSGRATKPAWWMARWGRWTAGFGLAAALVLLVMLPHDTGSRPVEPATPAVGANSVVPANAVYVKGYCRKDGRCVKGYWRSKADGDPSNNWSARGNRNPTRDKGGRGTQTAALPVKG